LINGHAGVLLFELVNGAGRLPVEHIPKRGHFFVRNQFRLFAPQEDLPLNVLVDFISIGNLFDHAAGFH